MWGSLATATGGTIGLPRLLDPDLLRAFLVLEGRTAILPPDSDRDFPPILPVLPGVRVLLGFAESLRELVI
jgi:hypothetical protein